MQDTFARARTRPLKAYAAARPSARATIGYLVFKYIINLSFKLIHNAGLRFNVCLTLLLEIIRLFDCRPNRSATYQQ